MAEYYPLILRAVAGLDPNTPELRRQVYERARAALTARLQGLAPPLSGAERMKARLALEEAFRTVESEVEKAAEYGVPFRQFAHHLYVADALRELTGKLDRRPHGAGIALADGTFGFVPAQTDADRGAAAAPFFERRLAEIRHSAGELHARTTKLLNTPGWSGLAHAVDMMCRCLRAAPDQISGGVGPLWSLSVSLAAYVERSEDARLTRAQQPLDPAVLDPLKDFVFAAGPWVRRFPSGRALDDEAHEFAWQAGDVEPGLALLRRATEAGLVREDDATVVWIALDAGRGESIPAAKVRGWSLETVRNLGTAMLKLLAQDLKHLGDEAAARIDAFAPLAQRIETVVRDSRGDLLALLSPVTDDGGAALTDALAALAQE